MRKELRDWTSERRVWIFIVFADVAWILGGLKAEVGDAAEGLAMTSRLEDPN